MAGAAATAIVAMVVIGVLAVVDRRSDADRTLESVLAAPDAAVVTLEGPAPGVTFTFSSVQRQGVLVAPSLPPVEDGRTYQFWLIGETGPRSGGLFRADPGALAVRADLSDLAAVGVTIEPAGGSVKPTGEILFFGSFSGAS